jgi:hypothetical protein
VSLASDICKGSCHKDWRPPYRASIPSKGTNGGLRSLFPAVAFASAPVHHVLFSKNPISLHTIALHRCVTMHYDAAPLHMHKIHPGVTQGHLERGSCKGCAILVHRRRAVVRPRWEQQPLGVQGPGHVRNAQVQGDEMAPVHAPAQQLRRPGQWHQPRLCRAELPWEPHS